MSVSQSYSDSQKKKVLSVFPESIEVPFIGNIKLYTAGTAGKEWLYSDLDGLLCFVVDNQVRTRYLQLFDPFSFTKLFQFELYNDFSKYVKPLAEDFRCFEVENGFIGFQFDLINEAKHFDIIVNKFEGTFLKNLFDIKLSQKNNDKKMDKNDKSEKNRAFYKILNDKFCSTGNYDESYAEDGTEIIKARNFEMLNNISYNRDTNNFEIGEISEELKNIFICAGIRKKDLQNDLDFAFKLFKQIILGVGDNKELLDHDKYHKVYYPPENIDKSMNDDQTIGSQETQATSMQKTDVKNNMSMPVKSLTMPQEIQKPINQSTINNNPSVSGKKSLQPPQQAMKPSTNASITNKPVVAQVTKQPIITKPVAKQQVPTKPVAKPVAKPPATKALVPKTTAPSVPKGNIPVPPPLPPGGLDLLITPIINTTATVVTSTMSKEEELAQMKLKKVEEDTRPKELSMYEQIANVQLKAVKKEAPQQKLMTKNEQNYLQNTLSAALMQRRQNLMKHQDEEEDNESDEDW